MKQNRHIFQAKGRPSGLYRPDDFYWEDLNLISVQKKVDMCLADDSRFFVVVVLLR